MANFLKLNLSTLEIVLSLLIVLYLVFQMKTPSSFANLINHPMGMLVIVVLTIYLFLNVHPILGILLIIAAYELIRRSSSKKVKHKKIPRFFNFCIKKRHHWKKMLLVKWDQSKNQLNIQMHHINQSAKTFIPLLF